MQPAHSACTSSQSALPVLRLEETSAGQAQCMLGCQGRPASQLDMSWHDAALDNIAGGFENVQCHVVLHQTVPDMPCLLLPEQLALVMVVCCRQHAAGLLHAVNEMSDWLEMIRALQ